MGKSIEKASGVVEAPAKVAFPEETITARFLCGAHLRRRITFKDMKTGNLITGTLQSFDYSSDRVSMWVYDKRKDISPNMFLDFDSGSNKYFTIQVDDTITLQATEV